LIDVPFSHLPFIHVHVHLPFCFNILFYFPGDWGELSIASLVAPPFQKVCGNCHITNLIISPMGYVHYNTYRSKSTIQNSGFFHDSITTNDEPMLSTIDGKCK
jgi:hypothetical protein